MEPEDYRMAREDPGREPGPNPIDPSLDRGRHPVEPVATASETEVVSHFSPARRAYEAIYILFAAICALLILRLALKLLAANTAAGFTGFIYGITDLLMAPFRGLLPVIVNGRTILEPSVLVAVLVYALVGYLLARLVAIMFMRDVTVAQGRRGRYRTY